MEIDFEILADEIRNIQDLLRIVLGKDIDEQVDFFFFFGLKIMLKDRE